jgi:hypothetical protein
MRYIAKANTWFDEGTEAVLLGEAWTAYEDFELKRSVAVGLFEGFRNGKLDQEVCPVTEFDCVQ